MSLIKCKECGKEISQLATSCPNCGMPLKKPTHKTGTFLIILLILVMLVGYFFYNPNRNDREERIAAAKELLNNHKEDIVAIATNKIKKGIFKAGTEILLKNRFNCVIDELAPQLADKYSLDSLNLLKVRAISNITIVTNLVEENHKICEDCLLFRK